MREKMTGLWQVYLNGDLYSESFYEELAVDDFEECVKDKLGEVELVRVLRTTRLNELMNHNKSLDTTSDWKLHPTVEGLTDDDLKECNNE